MLLWLPRGEDGFDAPVPGEIRPGEANRGLAGIDGFGAPVVAPVASDQVHEAIGVEVGGGEALPPSGQVVEPGEVGWREHAAIIAPDPDGTGLGGGHEVGVAVEVDVREEGAGDESGGVHGTGLGPFAVALGEPSGRSGGRPLTGDAAVADEQFQLAIAVEVCRGECTRVQAARDGFNSVPAGAAAEDGGIARFRGIAGHEPSARRTRGEDGDSVARRWAGEGRGGSGIRDPASGGIETSPMVRLVGPVGDEPLVDAIGFEVDPTDGRGAADDRAGKEGLAGEFVDGGGLLAVRRIEGDLGEPGFWGGRGGARLRRGGWLDDLVDTVRARIGDAGDAAAAPGYLEGECGIARSGGEGPNGIVRGQVSAAGDDFLRLRDGAVEDSDAGTDAAGVGGGAAEADGDAGRGGVVAKEGEWTVEVVGDDIEVAVVVEVADGHAGVDAGQLEIPGLAGVGERPIAFVAEGEERRGKGGEATEVGEAACCGRCRTHAGQFGQGIGMLHVVAVAGGEEQVLPTVEIDIEEDAAPGPFGGGDASEGGNLGEAAVFAGQVKGVMGDFRCVAGVLDGRREEACERVRTLPGAATGETAEHVGHEQIVASVAIDVRDIHAHGGKAQVTEGGAWGGAEPTAGLTDPDAVGGGGEVVADVKIGVPVAGEVPELDSQAPVGGRFAERLTGFVEEGARGPAHGCQPGPALVEVEEIAFAPFDEFDASTARRNDRDEPSFGRDLDRAVRLADRLNTQAGRIVPEGVRAVVRDVEVEVAIGVHVGHGHRAGAETTDQSTVGEFGEAGGAVIEEESGSASDGIDEEVEVAVAVDIG